MAEKIRPKPLLILERLIAALEEIGKDEGDWWTKPAKVDSFSSASQLGDRKPLILVRVVGVGHSKEPVTGLDMHGDAVELDIHYLADSPRPEEEAHAGARDIRRLIRQDHQLGGECLVLWETGYHVQIDSSAGGSRGLEAVVHAHALYETDEDNP